MRRGMIRVGIVASLVASFAISACGTNNAEPEPDAAASVDAPPSSCAEVAARVCARGCECGATRGCAFTRGTGYFYWDTNEECTNFWVALGCGGGQFHYQDCAADLPHASCTAVGEHNALLLPESCGSGS
jgi:hypothetical protein